MHYFSVCAMFKNEAAGLKEWLDHYLFHGADHFYLVNDQSTDNSLEVLAPYISKGLVTLIHCDWPRVHHRQSQIYTHAFLPRLPETRWMCVCDVDEYVWSPRHVDIKEVLRSCEGLSQIQIRQTIFGSNGHELQPASIVQGFTMRRADQNGTSIDHGYKYIIQNTYTFKKLDVHFAEPTEETEVTKTWLIINEDWFVLNHYKCQSVEHWRNVKCTRGDADEFTSRSHEDFARVDINEVLDTRLAAQNSMMEKI